MRSKIVKVYEGTKMHPYWLPAGTAVRRFIVVWKDRYGDTHRTGITENYDVYGAIMPEFLFKQACAKIRKILKKK